MTDTVLANALAIEPAHVSPNKKTLAGYEVGGMKTRNSYLQSPMEGSPGDVNEGLVT